MKSCDHYPENAQDWIIWPNQLNPENDAQNCVYACMYVVCGELYRQIVIIQLRHLTSAMFSLLSGNINDDFFYSVKTNSAHVLQPYFTLPS